MWSEFTVKGRSAPVLVLSCKYKTKVTCWVMLAVVYHFDTTANMINFANFQIFPANMVMWPNGDDALLAV